MPGEQDQAGNGTLWKKTKRLLLLTALLVALILVGWWVFLHPRNRDHPLQLWSVAFSPDGKMLVTAAGQDAPETLPQIGEVVFWDAATGKEKRIIREQAGVRRAVYSPDGKFIATCDFRGNTRLLDSSTGSTQATFAPQSRLVNAVAVSADSKMIAAGSFDGTITLWDLAGKPVDTLEVPKERILNLAISPDAQWLVAGCRQGNAYLFKLGEYEAPTVMPAYDGPPSYWCGIEAVAFAPDGQTFVTGGMNLRLWQTDTGDLVRELRRAGSARLNCLAFSPDGGLLAGVDRDGWLAIWKPTTAEPARKVQAHTGASFGLAYSPDGHRLATVDRKEFAIRLWNAETLELIATFPRTR